MDGTPALPTEAELPRRHVFPATAGPMALGGIATHRDSGPGRTRARSADMALLGRVRLGHISGTELAAMRAVPSSERAGGRYWRPVLRVGRHPPRAIQAWDSWPRWPGRADVSCAWDVLGHATGRSTARRKMVPAGRRRPAFASVREAQVGVEHGRSARGSVVTGRLLRVPWVTGAVLAVLAVNVALIVAGADSLPSPARALTQCSSAAPVPPQRTRPSVITLRGAGVRKYRRYAH